jgi:hypothetical protein
MPEKVGKTFSNKTVENDSLHEIRNIMELE